MKIFYAILASIILASCATTNSYEDANQAYERKDYFSAMQKFKIASEQGNSMATIKIGNMYDGGLGVKQDFSEAMRYYKLAARQGHVLGFVFVSAMYENGQGVPKNISEARRWKELANKCQALELKNCGQLAQ